MSGKRCSGTQSPDRRLSSLNSEAQAQGSDSQEGTEAGEAVRPQTQRPSSRHARARGLCTRASTGVAPRRQGAGPPPPVMACPVEPRPQHSLPRGPLGMAEPLPCGLWSKPSSRGVTPRRAREVARGRGDTVAVRLPQPFTATARFPQPALLPAGGGRGSGQVSLSCRPPGPELLSHTTLAPGCPIPSPRDTQEEGPMPLLHPVGAAPGAGQLRPW